MNQLTVNEIGMQELSFDEVDEVSGGILCLLVLCFVGGAGVGTAFYRTVLR